MLIKPFRRTTYVQSNFTGMHVIYRYEPINLVTSYAVALVATAIIVAVGLWSFYRNDKVSFDNKATTIAAAMQNPEVCTSLIDESVLRIGND